MGSVALGAFGIDSLIEILAFTMVVGQLNGVDTTDRTAPALRIIAVAFAGLAIHIAAHPRSRSPPPATPTTREPDARDGADGDASAHCTLRSGRAPVTGS